MRRRLQAAVVPSLGALLACSDPTPTGAQPSGGVALPDLERCDAARTRDADEINLESQVYQAITELRSRGADCASRGRFAAAEPLRRDGALICAARLHSDDMLMRNFVEHVDPDGVTPWERIAGAEYEAATADEVIAATRPQDGLDGAAIVEELWVTREGSCAALMAAPYVEIGVGVSIEDPSEGSSEATGADDEAERRTQTITVVVAKPRP